MERYDPETDSSEVFQGMIPHPFGDWVEYQEAALEISARDARIEELEELLKGEFK